MPQHKIAPDVLFAARRIPSARPRSSLIARLAARVCADRYDRMLAVGVPSEPGSALAAHRERLMSTAERHTIAHSLRQALCDAGRRSAPGPRVPVHVENIAAAEGLIDRVTLRLHAPRPVDARGMARLRLVVSDGAGPLYRTGRGDLSGRLGAALAAL